MSEHRIQSYHGEGSSGGSEGSSGGGDGLSNNQNPFQNGNTPAGGAGEVKYLLNVAPSGNITDPDTPPETSATEIRIAGNFEGTRLESLPGFAEPTGFECCCAPECKEGCEVVTVHMTRDVLSENQPVDGPVYCSSGWSAYRDVEYHPDPGCSKQAAKWRLINLPTCGVIKQGDIRDGFLVGLPNQICYPPYNGRGCTHGSWTFGSILWWIFWIGLVSARILNFIDDDLLFGGASGGYQYAFHCDSTLSCYYIVRLELGCIIEYEDETFILYPGGIVTQDGYDGGTSGRDDLPFEACTNTDVGRVGWEEHGGDWRQPQDPDSFPVPPPQ